MMARVARVVGPARTHTRTATSGYAYSPTWAPSRRPSQLDSQPGRGTHVRLECSVLGRAALIDTSAQHRPGTYVPTVVRMSQAAARPGCRYGSSGPQRGLTTLIASSSRWGFETLRRIAEAGEAAI